MSIGQNGTVRLGLGLIYVVFAVMLVWALKEEEISWFEAFVYVAIIIAWAFVCRYAGWDLLWIAAPVVVIDAILILKVVGHDPRIR